MKNTTTEINLENLRWLAGQHGLDLAAEYDISEELSWADLELKTIIVSTPETRRWAIQAVGNWPSRVKSVILFYSSKYRESIKTET